MKAFRHQDKEFSEHWTTEARALLWEPRTGKSKTIIDTACALYQACAIEGVVVIAPNGVHRNWTLNQLTQHHWPEVPYAEYAWRTVDDDRFTQVDRVSKAPGLAWFTVNMEVLIRKDVINSLKYFFRLRGKMVLMVVDESHHFAQPGSKRTGTARTFAKRAIYRRILTGTAVEESPLQAYSQFQILKQGCLGFSTYEEFKQRYAKYKTQYIKGHHFEAIDEYINVEELRDRMAQHSSVVLREDCDDLPAMMPDVRIAELSDVQRKYYELFKDYENPFAIRMLMQLGFTEPPVGGALLIKLQQIEAGYLQTPTELKVIDPDPHKFNIVLEELNGYTGIVWSVYTHEVEDIAKKLRAKGIETGIAHGGAPNREAVLKAFQAGQLQALSAQPRAISEGYEINAADKIIWHSQTPSAVVRVQANARATKVGTTKKQLVDIYYPTGVDKLWLDLTTTKTTLADYIARHGMKAILEGLGR